VTNTHVKTQLHSTGFKDDKLHITEIVCCVWKACYDTQQYSWLFCWI